MYWGRSHYACELRLEQLEAMAGRLENVNPLVVGRVAERRLLAEEEDDSVRDEIDAREIFGWPKMSHKFIPSVGSQCGMIFCADLVRSINDPEHPLTLEELRVVKEDAIDVSDQESKVKITFTPTIPHCSMATLIGLAIRVRLLRTLPERFKVRKQQSENFKTVTT